jgi:hypothetical protein
VNPPKSHLPSDWITVRVSGKSHLTWKFAAEKLSLTSFRTIFYFTRNWNYQNNCTLEKEIRDNFKIKTKTKIELESKSKVLIKSGYQNSSIENRKLKTENRKSKIKNQKSKIK